MEKTSLINVVNENSVELLSTEKMETNLSTTQETNAQVDATEKKLMSNPFVIVALKVLHDEGKKIAFVKGNRPISKTNIARKKTSIMANGILVPLMFVTGEKAIQDGCDLITPEGEDINPDDASDYIVIIDGQHRYLAAVEIKLDETLIYLFQSLSDKPTQTQLAESNIEIDGWKGGVFVAGALLKDKTNDLLLFMQALIMLGYPLTTASKIVSFGADIDKNVLARFMKGESLNVEYDLTRGQNFLNAARKKFDDKFISKRYLIDAAIKLVSGSSQEPQKVFAAIENLTSEEVLNILNAKGDVAVIKDIIKRHLA